MDVSEIDSAGSPMDVNIADSNYSFLGEYNYNNEGPPASPSYSPTEPGYFEYLYPADPERVLTSYNPDFNINYLTGSPLPLSQNYDSEDYSEDEQCVPFVDYKAESRPHSPVCTASGNNLVATANYSDESYGSNEPYCEARDIAWLKKGYGVDNPSFGPVSDLHKYKPKPCGVKDCPYEIYSDDDSEADSTEQTGSNVEVVFDDEEYYRNLPANCTERLVYENCTQLYPDSEDSSDDNEEEYWIDYMEVNTSPKRNDD